jgi:hypothetical protein
MGSNFNMSGTVTLDVDTRTLNDASYKGTLCIYLFIRHESGSPPTATDTMIANKETGLPYLSVTPSGTGQWWRFAWFELRQKFNFVGPKTVPVGDRLGLALSVERSGTGGDGIAFLYDHPSYRSRIEVETTTPLSGE